MMKTSLVVLFQPIWKILVVKLDHETPKIGMKIKKCLKPPPRFIGGLGPGGLDAWDRLMNGDWNS